MSSGGLLPGDASTRDQVGADFAGSTQNLPLRLSESDVEGDALDVAAAPAVHPRGRIPTSGSGPCLPLGLERRDAQRTRAWARAGWRRGRPLPGLDRPARGRLPPGHRAAAPSGAGPRARWPARARRAGEQTGGRWGSRAGPEHLDGLTGCGGAGGERRDASPPSHCVVGRMDVSNARDCAHSTRMAKGILPSDPRRSSRCHSAAHYPSTPTRHLTRSVAVPSGEVRRRRHA